MRLPARDRQRVTQLQSDRGKQYTSISKRRVEKALPNALQGSAKKRRQGVRPDPERRVGPPNACG
jgi:hypothetical protein